MKLLCATCSDSRILASCCRCERHYCASHVPSGGELCRICELEYIERSSKLRLNLWVLLGFALIIPLVALLWSSNTPTGLISLPPKVFLLGFGTFAGWYLAKTSVNLRLFFFRRDFDLEVLPKTLVAGRVTFGAPKKTSPELRLTA